MLPYAMLCYVMLGVICFIINLGGGQQEKTRMIAVCGRSGVQWKHESERCAGVMILIYCHSSFIRRASGMKNGKRCDRRYKGCILLIRFELYFSFI